MKLNNTNISISKGRNGNYKTNLFDNKWRETLTSDEFTICETLYKVYKLNTISDLEKHTFLKNTIDHYGLKVALNETTVTTEAGTTVDSIALEDTLGKLINFFTEFEFEPNFRFVNTFAYKCNNSMKDAKDYITRYFELTDSPYTTSLIEKMKSEEFRLIVDSLKGITPNHKVNNRFKLYYGSQGTGKTTDAMKETMNNCMVCHSAMLPSDLMEDFKFEDGKATFVPSALQLAMTEGKEIVLDEINLLPFESLRFLQSILDGKSEFTYKGKLIEIKDGFKIIGTMNLTVNGSVYSLPAPLVDRCEDIKKYNLTAKNLVGAIL